MGSFHKKHKKSMLNSELLEIKGVGESKKNKLIKEFRSIKKIKEAGIEELAKIVDKTTAENIFNHFHS